MAHLSTFAVGEAVEDIYICGFHYFGYVVAQVAVYLNVPFQSGARWTHGCVSLYGAELLNPVVVVTVNAGKGAKTCAGVAIAGGLATPWRAVDIWDTVDNADSGVVVIHKVTAWDKTKPVAYLGRFACAAGGIEGITVTIVPYK